MQLSFYPGLFKAWTSDVPCILSQVERSFFFYFYTNKELKLTTVLEKIRTKIDSWIFETLLELLFLLFLLIWVINRLKKQHKDIIWKIKLCC